MLITRPDRQADLRAPRTVQTGLPVADSLRLVARLTERDRWILRMLHEHRVLTTNQLAALAFPTRNLARRRLATLHRERVVDRFRPFTISGSAPWHWVLAPAGAGVLAAEAGAEVRELGYHARRRLDIAHSLHLAHTLGVNDWFTTLAITATDHDATLPAWWAEARCRRLWGDLARPDSYGRYTRHEHRLDFFLEYDLATTSLTRVAAKLLGYSELARSTGIITPILLWVPTGRRELAARQALRETAASLPDPAAVPVATAAADYLDTTATHPSPADRVWLPLDSTHTSRLHLHDLADTWPQCTPPPAGSSEDSPITLGGQIMLTAPPPLFEHQS
ncbi:replication-relaxation family protein [Nocardia nova]|uniref:replication-relaxation family protein n=1 Tax=Nocardia nova TaxID=37330 RepID=UPI001C436875|nr:replication-relaxation family protein [Nocardia nova]MBV7706501.1 replication-relaxation family protein [Nocardia nova]